MITTWSRSHSSFHVQDSAEPTMSVWIQLLREAAMAKPRQTQLFTFSIERFIISAAVYGRENKKFNISYLVLLNILFKDKLKRRNSLKSEPSPKK